MDDQKPTSKRIEKRPGTVLNHMIKNSKALHGDKAQLTPLKVKAVVEHCFSRLNDSPEAALLLASIFTGQEPPSLLASYRLSLTSNALPKVEGCFLLQSNWEFPQFRLFDEAVYLLQQPSRVGWVVLPHSLEPSFKQMLTKEHEEFDIDSKVKSFISYIQNDFSQRITLAKLTKVISYCAVNYSLSCSDLAYIGNEDLKSHAHCFYGCFNLKHLNERLCGFIKDISDERCFISPPVLPDMMFGSLRVAKDDTVKGLFSYYRSQMECNPICIEAERRTFNAILFYVISLLEICTMHRDLFEQYGSIRNFDLETGHIFIQDKGDASYRILPLCDLAVATLNTYIQYLTKVMKKHRFAFKNVSNCIESAIDGETNLFNVWVRDELQTYSPAHNSTYRTQVIPLPKNWARHYVCTSLIEMGFNRNDISVFMGHASSPDISYSIFSASDFNNLVDISEAIEELICTTLQIPYLGDIIQ